MKYIVPFVLLFTAITSTIADPSISISYGLNYSSIAGSDSLVSKNSLRQGYRVNLGLEQNFTRYFSLLTGASLESRGEKNIISRENEMVEKIEILNLQLPVQAQFNIPFSIFCLNIFAGPELGVFLSGDKKRETHTIVPATELSPEHVETTGDTINFSEAMKMLEFGISGGIGFEIKTGNFGAFVLKSGVYLGLTNILDRDSTNDSTSSLSGENSSIYFSVGYKFNIKPKKSKIKDNSDNENALDAPEPSIKKASSYPSNVDQYNNYKASNSNSSTSGYESSGSGSSSTDSDSGSSSGSDSESGSMEK